MNNFDSVNPHMKKRKMIGIWDDLDEFKTGDYYACFYCARKRNLSLCGTPTGKVSCQFCGAEQPEKEIIKT